MTRNVTMEMCKSRRVSAAGGSKGSDPASGATWRDARARDSEDWSVGQTRHELQIDWSTIAELPESNIRAGFTKIAALCDSARKDEFVIENIAPAFVVGRDDASSVMAIQDRIARLLREALDAIGRPVPEYRLSLRRGIFDLRIYLGRTRPTDFTIDDDY